MKMDYNTSLPKMIIPEYGRNIQRMIDQTVALEDREQRNINAKAIINVMGQINPHLRDIADFKHKLWDHLFIISEFKLDVDSPFPKPTRETFISKPAKVAYPAGNMRYKHYGQNIERIIAKGMEFEEGPEKEYFTQLVANILKKSYLTWNQDSVNDGVVLQHLGELSNGKLKLDDLSKLVKTEDVLAKIAAAAAMSSTKKKAKSKNNNGKNYSNFQNNNRNNNRRRF